MWNLKRRSGIQSLGLAMVLGLSLAGPAPAAEIPPMRPGTPPGFTADLVLSADTEGRPAMAVTISIPYASIQWIRLPEPHAAGRFGAATEISVSFRSLRGVRLHGDSWERRVVVGSYAASNSPRSALTERRTFDLPPGRYQATVRVRDLNAGIESVARQSLEVPDYSRVPVGFSDLELGVTDSTGLFEPVPTRTYGVEARRIAARVSLFDRRPGPWPRSYALRYWIADDGGLRLVEDTLDVQVDRPAAPILIRPKAADLFVGRYVMEVELKGERNRWRVDRSFEVQESGPPTGQEFTRILEPLSYVAPWDEIEHLRKLATEHQATGWEEFWRRRDPTPDTPRNEALIEFIRRLRHAERHFVGNGRGWRSDMGRIYIRYGAPDQTETRAASGDAPQLEIWYYQESQRRFVFGDREGFGRFILISPIGE